MATAAERSRLRDDIGADSTTLSDAEADEIFIESGEVYTDANSLIAYTRVIAIRRLLASSAKLVSYRQNETQESASDVFKHLKDLLKLWQDETIVAVNLAAGSVARFGKTKYQPTRIREYPGL
jgi:hypothetical protein